MTEKQQKELLDMAKVFVILWTGTFPPSTWAHNMDKLSKWLDDYGRGGTPKTGDTLKGHNQ